MTEIQEKPQKFTKFTGHLIWFSKGWYGRTGNQIDDLATFMFNWSWTPKDFYTPYTIYPLVASSFVECCPKWEIENFIKGLFDPLRLHYLPFDRTDPNKYHLTIEEAISSMISLISCLQIFDRDNKDNLITLIELPEKDLKLCVTDEAKNTLSKEVKA